MSAHTPGPWELTEYTVRGPDGGPVAEMWVSQSTPWRLNGRLIAAAPDLLATLRRLLWANNSSVDAQSRSEALDAARAVIDNIDGAKDRP